MRLPSDVAGQWRRGEGGLALVRRRGLLIWGCIDCLEWWPESWPSIKRACAKEDGDDPVCPHCKESDKLITLLRGHKGRGTR